MSLLELLPLKINIVICKIQRILDIILVCTVKDRCSHIETKRLRSK